MPTVPLPEEPNLDQLRKQARELQRSHGGSLSSAQLTLARKYGFPSWPRIRAHVLAINAHTWTPSPEDPNAPPADRFLRLACLNYDADRPDRRDEARRLMAANPLLPSTNLAVAAVCADLDAVQRLIAAAPQAVSATAGPYDWSPLMYLTYGRVATDSTTVAVARMLIDAGADPNDGRFFRGLPTPFTVLTGVFGSDSPVQPAHPHADALARVLLDAGADPNDGQALYNRMFGLNDDHLSVLFEYGLGRGDGGPWHRLLGEQLESPTQMLAALLDWATAHDQRSRVALLAAHGVDVVGPIVARRRYSSTGSTPIEVALLNGNVELADQLRILGAIEPTSDPVEIFIAAALAGHKATTDASAEDVIAVVRTTRPGLIVWAAGLGRVATLELLVAKGFDINAKGRSDVPIEMPWETALHAAVSNDDVELATRLLELGANPDIRDQRFDGTPLDWAYHLEHPDLIDLLAPVTASRDSLLPDGL